MLQQRGLNDRALAAFRRAFELEPTHPIANNLGFLQLRMADPVGAAQSFQASIRLAPEHPDARWGLGNALRAQRDHAAAAAAYHEALRLQPDCAEAFLGLALSAEATGDLLRALELMRKCDAAAKSRSDWTFPTADRVRELEERLRGR
jgi:tetratricopeptide (TPR) repeat protein